MSEAFIDAIRVYRRAMRLNLEVVRAADLCVAVLKLWSLLPHSFVSLFGRWPDVGASTKGV